MEYLEGIAICSWKGRQISDRGRIFCCLQHQHTCPYCVDAHSGMLHALSEHSVVLALRQNNNDLVRDSKLRGIMEWSLATRDPDAEIVKSPPFTRDEAPEIIGTAVIYHFVNRMANIFLESSPLPVPAGWKGTKKVALRIFGATVAKRIVKRAPKPGESLQFITQSVLPPDLAWAKNSDSIAAAFASFALTIGKVVEGLLSETARNVIQQRILSWRGEDMGLSKAWLYDALENMAEADKPAGEIALLTAFSPHQIGADTINRFRSIHPGDAALLNITAWASFSTARRIGAWLGYPERN